MQNDPMNSNEDREEAEEKAVEIFSKAMGNTCEEIETQLTDLVIDMFHFCAVSGISVNQVNDREQFHFNCELTQES